MKKDLVIHCPTKKLFIAVSEKLVKDGYPYFSTEGFSKGDYWDKLSATTMNADGNDDGYCNLSYYRNSGVYKDYKFLEAEQYLGLNKFRYNKIMNKITSKIKRIFNESFQAQYQAELINDCGSLTSLGKDELDELIRADYEEKLTERAREIIKESKEK